VLVGSNSEQAHVVAERIRKQIEETVIDLDGNRVQVTISIGIASYPAHATSKEDIIEIADRAMYCGKHKSRNIVYVAS
jgi:diguanylate cyclase (GGDEF)-like protein